jgi:hypothetical protein
MDNNSTVFRKLFEMKLKGVHGGLEWIVWSLNEMVHDLIGNKPDIFCQFIAHYFVLQLRVQRMACHRAAEKGTLIILGRYFKIHSSAVPLTIVIKNVFFIDKQANNVTASERISSILGTTFEETRKEQDRLYQRSCNKANIDKKLENQTKARKTLILDSDL